MNEALDEQWKLCYKRCRNYINNSRTIQKIKNANLRTELDSFIDFYSKNMRQVNPNAVYFFDKKYFLDLLNSTDCDTELSLAINKETDDIYGGSILTKKNSIVQYHLSGT